MHEGPVVVFSGGGTGGHLYPALAIADALRARRPDVRALFMGSVRGVEGPILERRGEWHLLLPVRGFDRSRPFRSLSSLGSLPAAVGRALLAFLEFRPEVVVVTGGYAGAPGGLAAGLAGIPLLLQEQNAVPGVVTRLLARFAAQIHVAYPEAGRRLSAPAAMVRTSGNPIRAAGEVDRAQARVRLGIEREERVILIVGGSQGAQALNRAVLEMVGAVRGSELERPEGASILWATGPRHHAEAEAALADTEGAVPWVRVVPYIDDMPSALAAADLALCRAGAMFTAELLAYGVPAVLVPLPTAAEDHQTRNAEALAAAGVALHLPQAELTADRLWRTLTRLLESPEDLSRMRRAALGRARPEAADEIAAAVERLLSPGGDGS